MATAALNDMTLNGRVVLVTGGATGIGRAIALRLAHAGAAVAVNHLDNPAGAAAVVDAITRAGGRALAVAADVTQSEQINAMLARVQAQLGNVDVLVNNAGILQEQAFLDISEDDWDRMLAVDLKSVFLVSRAVLPGMLARQGGDSGSGGVIINMASDLGILGREHFAAYSAAKAGVIGLTRAMAREFAPAIRVNAVAPGPVNTAMVSLATQSPAALAKEVEIPQHRIAEPDEIAATVLFLASDLSRFYCGQVLGPNGGSVMP